MKSKLFMKCWIVWTSRKELPRGYKGIIETGVKKLHLGHPAGALECFRQVAAANPNDKCLVKHMALAESCIASPDSDSRVIRFTQK